MSDVLLVLLVVDVVVVTETLVLTASATVVVGVVFLEAEVPVQADVAVEALDAHALDKVQHVDQVAVGHVPALHAHDVHEHVQVGLGTQTAVEDDPRENKLNFYVTKVQFTSTEVVDLR